MNPNVKGGKPFQGSQVAPRASGCYVENREKIMKVEVIWALPSSP
jgi:hypothetical protein